MGLVVLDICMPYILGTEILAEIKARFPSIPVIMLSAKEDHETVNKCMNLGAVDYLFKPVERDVFLKVLVNIIRLYMGKRKRLPESLK